MLMLLLAALVTQTVATPQPPPGMDSYYVGLLWQGTVAGTPEMMKGHMAHLDSLERRGVLVGAGPVAARAALAGVLILKGPTADEATALVNGDPAVQSGRFKAQVLPWWGPKDIGKGYGDAVARGESPKMRTFQFGVLKAGPNRTHPADEAARINDGHMAHIRAMSGAGKLVAAGPFTNGGELRGLFIFAASADEAQALAADDPAIKAGRLTLDLYPWAVAEGVLPSPAK